MDVADHGRSHKRTGGNGIVPDGELEAGSGGGDAFGVLVDHGLDRGGGEGSGVAAYDDRGARRDKGPGGPFKHRSATNGPVLGGPVGLGGTGSHRAAVGAWIAWRAEQVVAVGVVLPDPVVVGAVRVGRWGATGQGHRVVAGSAGGDGTVRAAVGGAGDPVEIGLRADAARSWRSLRSGWSLRTLLAG